MHAARKISLKDKSALILLFLIFLFVTYFTFVSFSRHDNFYSLRLDLGNMDQTIWNVLHGNGFTLTDPTGNQQESRLAVHADFLLILLSPLYLLWSTPKTLLLVQSVVSGLGALPIYWIAQDKLKSKKLALLFSVAFLLYPPMQRTLLHDFHAVALSTTFLLFAYWYMYKEKFTLFVIFALLAALGKEHIWLVTGLMGLYIVIIKKKLWPGLITAGVSFAVFYFLFWKAIPAVTFAKQHFALGYLSDFGGDQNTIIKNILTNPLRVLVEMTSYDRIYYFFQLLIPVGFLSLFSPLKLFFAAPSILINSLSNNPLMRKIDYQYNSTISPFIFVSAIEGYMILHKLLNTAKQRGFTIPKFFVSVWLLLMIFISSYLWGELPFERNSRFSFFLTPQQEKENINNMARKIDSRYSVSVTNNIGAHFSQRQLLYNFPVNAEIADFTLVQLGDPHAWPSEDEQKKVLYNLLNNRDYELIAQQGNFYAFKKKSI